MVLNRSYIFILLLVVSLSCNRGDSTKTNLTISAAISLKNALEEIKSGYLNQHPNISITYNYGSSGAVGQQIEHGAPTDIFISAAPRYMDALEHQGLLLPGTRRNLLANRLVLITSRDDIQDIQDLITEKIKKVAVGEPRSVPVGGYTEETLRSLGIADQVAPKLVFAKDVRQVLTYVETGDADAGFVYVTDARQSSKVKIVSTVSDSTHSSILYPAAVLRQTANEVQAREFLSFLSSESAQVIFEKYGFLVHSSSPRQ
ncbi:MAG: molybdate ABC transporter substrate-binding protein [Ignavibacteria bacterium]|nr:molybdate ABC transporter substrate-binding protein [Ignavibacteria bacterium]